MDVNATRPTAYAGFILRQAERAGFVQAAPVAAEGIYVLSKGDHTLTIDLGDGNVVRHYRVDDGNAVTGYNTRQRLLAFLKSER